MQLMMRLQQKLHRDATLCSAAGEAEIVAADGDEDQAAAGVDIAECCCLLKYRLPLPSRQMLRLR